jgi:tRNA pseudouridine13 synthase
LSALRSELFNRIVDTRIRDGIWLEPVDGDLFMLNGSQSLFSEDIAPTLTKRYTRQDIHCACALYGSGEQRVHGLAAQLEHQVFDAAPEMIEILQREKLKLSYRSNRALTGDLQLRYLQSDVLEIKTRLARGTYFTAFLDHWLDYR